MDAVQTCARRECRAAAGPIGSRSGAHRTQRYRDALHRPPHERGVADQAGIEALAGEQSRKQSHGGTRNCPCRGVPSGAARPCIPTPSTSTVAGPAPLDAARRARAWPRASRGNLRCRESRRCACALRRCRASISARCEIDLSPGTVKRAADATDRSRHDSAARDRRTRAARGALMRAPEHRPRARQRALDSVPRAGRDAQMVRQPVVAHADVRSRPAATAPSKIGPAGRPRSTSTKLPAEGSDLAGRALAGRVRSCSRRAIERHGLADMLVVIERRSRGGERQRVHVEGLAQAIQGLGDLRLRHRVTDSQAGQSMRLRKRAHDDEVWKFCAATSTASGQSHITRIFEIGLVHDSERAGRQRLQRMRASAATRSRCRLDCWDWRETPAACAA